jgi:prepilin-type N-terminal cleavage/methylation domain-containing protein
MPPRPLRPIQAFTIIEMLTVLAIIGILAAILIPTVTGSTTSAKRAKTKVQFAQWATAIEGFRQEYGYYPSFGLAPDFDFDDGKINESAYLDSKLFVETLSGRPINSAAMGANGNTKRITFCTFGSGELTSDSDPRLQDAFGNKEFVVLMDRNQDGMIRVRTGSAADDYTDSDAAPDVRTASNTVVPSPVSTSVPIRAGVAIYSAGDGQQPVKSW